jgi:hypothetical protein
MVALKANLASFALEACGVDAVSDGHRDLAASGDRAWQLPELCPPDRGREVIAVEVQPSAEVAGGGDGPVALCPGRKPPFWAAKRPASPYKRAIQLQFTVEYAKGG